jgi:hypothetical protein
VAGIGDAWGTRDELLHPRDKHGRFRSKWKMAEGVVDKITGFLSGFRPRTFQSDQQAAQYNQNLGGKKRFSLSELARLHADFAPAQEDLRDGDVDDPSTKKFTQMMDSHAIELPDDVIVSRVVGPDAFGLTPQTMNAEDGGLEDFTGKKIADRGYSPVNLGTPLGGGSGQITMSIAVPKGTKATIPGQGGNDRSMYLQRSQSYRVTKVKPDGRGGYYILAVAENDGIEAPEPIGGHVGAGKPGNREGAVRDLQRSQAERMKAEPDQPSTAPAPVGDGGQPQADNTPQTQPALPDGTQPRTEPVAAESIGGGPAPTAPARTDVTPTAPQATVPETPAAPAGPPLEDADVAKLRLRRDAKARYQEMARAAPVAQAMAGLSELDSKKVDDKAKAAEIRRILASPVMDEVPKESVGIRADLEQVAKDFEAGKPNLAKARMTRLAKTQGLTSGDKAGSVVDFDEATMDPVGDIPEDGKVEILRPAITRESVLSRGESVVMERAQVTGAITPSARKAAKKVAAPATKKVASTKKATPKVSTAEDAAVSVLMERVGEIDPSMRDEILRNLSPEDRKRLEEAQARHQARMGERAAKKVAAPAAKKAAPTQGGTAPETVKGADGENIKVGDTVVIGTTNRGQYGRTEWKITKTYPNGTVDLQSTYETSTHKARTRNGVDPSTLRRAGATAAKKATPAATGEITDKSTVADLRKIAADRGVDIKGLRLKKDIRDRIEGKSAPAPQSKAAEQRAAVEANRAGNDTSSRARAAKTMVGKDLGSVDAVARAVSKKAAPAAASDKDARIQELLGKKPTVADLKKYAQDNDIPVTKSRPLKADLVDAILSHKSGKATETPAKKAAPPAPVKKAAPSVTAPKPAAKETRPQVPHGSRPLDTPERKADFKAAWIDSGIQKDIPTGQQNAELNEVFVRLRNGRYTPTEAVDSLEDTIIRNKEDAADMEANLRMDMSDRDRENLKNELEKLRTGIKAQEKASAFLRKYFAGEEKTAPPAPAPTPIPKSKPQGSRVVNVYSQVTDENGRIIKLNRPKSDEPLHLPNGGGDQGLMHLDSELGTLWADLYKDPREPNSFINEIARTGDALGEGQIDLNEVLKRLRALKVKAGDTGVEARVQDAIDAIDAPPVKVPDLPEGTPAPVKKFLEELAKIPTARKTGRIGASNPRESVLDKKIKAIRDFSEGKIRARQLEQELSDRTLHESADGAFAMWKLGERLMSRTFEHYEKDANGKTIVVSEPNPDWPAIQEWLRSERTRQQN